MSEPRLTECAYCGAEVWGEEGNWIHEDTGKGPAVEDDYCRSSQDHKHHDTRTIEQDEPEFRSVQVHKLHVELLVNERKLKEWFCEVCPDHPDAEPLRFTNGDGSMGAMCGHRHPVAGTTCNRSLPVWVAAFGVAQ